MQKKGLGVEFRKGEDSMHERGLGVHAWKWVGGGRLHAGRGLSWELFWRLGVDGSMHE